MVKESCLSCLKKNKNNYVARFNVRITFMYNEEHNLKMETIV